MKKQKLLSLFVAFMMILSSSLPQTASVFAEVETFASNEENSVELVAENTEVSKDIKSTSGGATVIKPLNEEDNELEKIELEALSEPVVESEAMTLESNTRAEPEKEDSEKVIVFSKDDYEDDINQFFNELTAYYEDESNWNSKITLAYTNGGGSTNTGDKKTRNYSTKGVYNAYQGIFRALALELDPRAVVASDGSTVNYVQVLEENQKSDGQFNSNIETNMWLMQAAKISCASINEEKAVDYMASKLVVSDDKAHNNSSVDNTAKILMALTLYPETEQSKELIPKCINWLKEEQLNDASFDSSPKSTALAARALTNAGEDIFSNDYLKGDEHKSVIDYINTYKLESGGIKSYSFSSYADASTTLEVYTFLSELQNKESMFQRYTAKVGSIASKLIVSNDNLELIEGNTAAINVKAYDKDGLSVPTTTFKWVSADTNIVTVNDGQLKALKKGSTIVTVSDATNNNVKSEIKITVVEEIVSKIVLKSAGNTIDSLNFLVGDKCKLDLLVYNQNEQEINSSNYSIEIIQNDIFINNSELEFTAQAVGTGKIKIVVETFEQVLNFSVTDVNTLVSQQLNNFQKKLTKDTSLDDFDILLAGAHGFINGLDSNHFNMNDVSCVKGYSYENPKEYGNRILSLLAQEKDPYDDNGKDLIQFLTENQEDSGFFYTKSSYSDDEPEYIAAAMLGLDAAGGTYNIDTATDLLMKSFRLSGDKAYIQRYSYQNYEKIMLATAALSNHRDIDGVDELLIKIENYLVDEFKNNALKGEKLGQIAVSFNALNKPLDTLMKQNNGQETSLLKLLCQDEEESLEVYAGLIGHVKNKSIYQLVDLVVGEPASLTINIANDKTVLKVGSQANYVISVKDLNNKIVKNFDYTIEALTPDVIAIDKDNKKLEAKTLGKTDVKITLIGTDLSATVSMEVITPKVIRTELNPVATINDLENNKRLKFNPISYDTEEEMTPYQSEWHITPSTSGHMDGNTFVAEQVGDVKIDYIVTNKDGSIVKTSLDISLIETLSKETLANDAISSTYENILSKYNYDYLDALALRNAGVDFKKIQEKKNIYNTPGIHSTSRNVMTLIGANINPEVKKNTIEGLAVDGASEQQYYSKLLIALDMMNSKINRETIVNEISKTIKTSGNQKYIEISVEEYDSYWDEWTWVNQKYPEETLWAWIALSNYKDIEGVQEILTGIENYVIDHIDQNLLVDNSAVMTSLAIQGIIANGYSVEDDKFTKDDLSGNKLTLIDGLLSCKKGDKFTVNPSATSSYNINKYVVNALKDYIEGQTTYKRIRFVEVGQPKKMTLEFSTDAYVEGDDVTLIANLFDQNNLSVLTEHIDWTIMPADAGIIEEVSNQSIKLTLLKPGVTSVTARVTNYKNITNSATLTVKSCIDKSLLDQRVKNEIEFFNKLYNETNKKYEFLGAPAATGVGITQKNVGDNVLHYSSMSSISNVSKQIIALIGGGLSPRAYKKNGSAEPLNLVDLLIENQQSSGDAIGQFGFRASEYNSLYNNAISIIALDMAQGQYNETDAINALIKLIESELKANSNREAEYLAYALIALAPHKELDGVKVTIENIKNRLHQIQNKDAGFDLNNGQHSNSPIATGLVIQGLIAVGENPLYDAKWVKNRKTVLDALLLTKHEDDDVNKSGYYQYVGFEMTNYKALYHAYAAMSDMYNKSSMFTEQQLDENAGAITDKIVTRIAPKGNRWVDDSIHLCHGERFILEANAYNSKNQLIKDAQLSWSVAAPKLLIENTNELIAKETSSDAIIVTVSVDNKGVQFTKDIKVYIEEKIINRIELVSPHSLFKTNEKTTLSANVYNQFNGLITDKKLTYQIEAKKGTNVAQINEETGEIEFLSAGTIGVTATIKKTDDTLIQSSTITLKVVEPISKTVFVSIYGIDASGQKKIDYPIKSVTVDNFDIGNYGDLTRQFYEYPVVMNALIKRLELEGLDCHDENKFDVMGNLSFLYGIDGIDIDPSYPNSGWMYYINNNYSSNNMNEQALNNSDHINVFYVLDYENINYYSITPNSETIGKNQNLKVTLNKKVKIPNTNDYKVQPVENATITIDGVDALFEGKIVTTDKLGQATITFEQDGEYLISAKLANHIETAMPPAYLVKVQDNSLMKNIEMTYKNFETLKAGYESSFNFSFKSLSEEARMLSYEVSLFENDKLIQQIHLSRKAFKDIIISEKFTFLLPDSEDLSIKIFYVDSSGNKELIKSHKIKE